MGTVWNGWMDGRLTSFVELASHNQSHISKTMPSSVTAEAELFSAVQQRGCTRPDVPISNHGYSCGLQVKHLFFFYWPNIWRKTRFGDTPSVALERTGIMWRQSLAHKQGRVSDGTRSKSVTATDNC